MEVWMTTTFVDRAREVALRTLDNVERVMVGKRSSAELALVAILSGGHILIEDVPGVGKTMLAHALGHLAIARDYSVHCESADKLFQRLRGSRLDDTHTAELRKLIGVDLLIIDDFGLRTLTETETADFFELVTARHQTASIVLTSNRDPSNKIHVLREQGSTAAPRTKRKTETGSRTQISCKIRRNNGFPSLKKHFEIFLRVKPSQE